MGTQDNCLEKIRGKIVVSVQADQGEPFYPSEAIALMARSVLDGGAAGLRMANAVNIRHIKSLWPDVPVIGITKPAAIPENYEAMVYITPAFEDVRSLAEVGTEIVALDATRRPRPGGETLAEIVTKTRRAFPNLLLMADIATLEEGLAAAALGFDLVSTTLSGYTTETHEKLKSGPDFALLESLSRQINVPVIMEGRVWEPDEVTRAFACGAFAVVIGSAITRPHHITRRFCQAIPVSARSMI